MGGTRIRVRRERPGAARTAIALALAMLMLYLITRFGGGTGAAKPAAKLPEGERVVQEVTFGALEGRFVQMGALDDPGDARVEAARYANRGAAGYVKAESGLYRILGAGYLTDAEAERAAEALAAQGVETCVYSASAPAVTLRISAVQAEIDALTRAEALLRGVFSRLCDVAGALEAGETDEKSALARISLMRYEAEQAGIALEAVKGWAENSVSRGLAARVSALAGDLRDLGAQNAGTSLSFSSRIRYNSIDARLGHIAWLSGLGE